MKEALERAGARKPSAHLFGMRAESWATTLVSRRPFREEELRMLRAWVADQGWEVVLDPNGSGVEPFVKLVHAEASRRDAYFERYPFNVEVPTDDAPFFFEFYRWRNLLNPPVTRGGYVITRVPVGYAVLLASLIQMVVLAALCILGPLWSSRSRLLRQPHVGRRTFFFAALGVGFMTIEITAIQAFTVFLGHPIYSMAVTLASLLLSTGLGSALAGRRQVAAERVVGSALVVLVGWVVLTVVCLAPLLDATLAWPREVRAVLVSAWLLPAGLALGTPFPTAIRAMQAQAPALVPWAWGTNACFSVIASLASVLVAMQVGFRVTLVLAAALYIVAYLAWRGTVVESR
jgi:hypothetical protein